MTGPSVRNLPTRRLRALLSGVAMVAVTAACNGPLDFDLRGRLGNDAFDTSQAAVKATADRPAPDDRGILSYPNYQVAVARRGDTLRDVATRVGVDANALAQFNGLEPETKLRAGEVVALHRRVSEPGPASGPIDITALAGNAIESADSPPIETASLEPAAAAVPATPVVEPVRHKVERGETAFSISRLYSVSVRALADWNGLGADYAIREGQYLLIPVATQDPPPQVAPTPVSEPGTGSATPTPPSASKPLPQETAVVATPIASAPDLGQSQSAAPSGRMALPVKGSIIRDYAKGKNDGIDISAPAGTSVTAAANGTVGAVTANADNAKLVVVKHADNLLTVYLNVVDVTVKKGDSVTRGQTLAKVPPGDPSYVHFEVRNGFESVDPNDYVN